MSEMTLVRVYVTEHYALGLEVSPWLLGLVLLAAAVAAWRWWAHRPRLDVVSISLDFGGIGTVELKPSVEDLQIAHRIWTELVTRKAAIPFDTDHDLIQEVYDSWYALFGRIRSFVADIPAAQLRTNASTRELVRIAVAALNDGLRPHLTRWHARYRNWYSQQTELLKSAAPQDVQRRFPEYEALISDMRSVNTQLIQYARQLEKVVRGS
jgi:hypothetical protein